MAKKRYAVPKALPACTALLVSLFAAVAVTAQGLPAGIALMIAQARKANADLMRQYTWHSRTELIVGGQVKDTRIDLVNYGPDGKLQRSLLNDQSAPMPRGFLRKVIAEDEKKKTEEYLAGPRGLLEQYTLSTTGKVLDFMEQAKVSGPDSQGLIQFTGNGVVVPGDSMTVSADMASRQTRRIVVNSSFQGDAVELTATFKTLASGGLVYTAFAAGSAGTGGTTTTTVTTTTTTYAMGAIYATLPPGAMSINKGGTTYYLSGNTWFQPSYGANGVYYRVVPTP